MKKIINPWRNHEGYNCFGCSPDNPIGLHMEFYEDGDYIMSTWHPEHNYQGWVGSSYDRTRADHTGESDETGKKSGLYQCRNNELEG